MFSDLVFHRHKPIYTQVYDYIYSLISKGLLPPDSKLPSTRELSAIMKISRNSALRAYELLQDDGFIYSIKDKGTYVSSIKIDKSAPWKISWQERVNDYAKESERLDIVKHELSARPGMISFKSIAPDEKLFDLDEVKRCLMNRIALEGSKIFNYGYAKGYKPLIDHILQYMGSKGVDTAGKDILITNGFTEGFELLVSVLLKPGDKILCENPTHNTALKIMRLHKLQIAGVDMESDGIDIEKLEKVLSKGDIKAAYLIPSYHNPTGIVMSYEKRIKACKLFRQYDVPLIEDGFNEELLYTGSHIAPMAAMKGSGDGIIYAGSLSKVLFPGLRIGWIMADKELVSIIESVKRSRNIHCSTLDQALLYEFMAAGGFDRYIKRIRKHYKEKYELAVMLAEKYIPCRNISGDGGFHIFIKLKGINSRSVLERCFAKGVVFLTGDIFYTDGGGSDTLRLGFSRVSSSDMEKGFRIIGEIVKNSDV